MKPEEILARRAQELADEKAATFREAFAETRDLAATVERVRSRRGGARPGAGRKPGSGTGRKATARLEFNVSDDFKQAFEARAEAEGVSKVELLRRLFDATRDN
ncbi:MAG: hypothetical protein IKK39_09055 [Thermoguttaceae bacterium]|nr:hypothetical protein [Thermoguttaceae bacterium]MBR4104191.1 hypothetical protein [Thermoguttaceae bacterium]